MLIQESQIKSKTDELELAKEKRGHFLYHLFCQKEFFLTFVFYLNVQSVEYTFRKYILLHIKRNYFVNFFACF